MSSSTARGATSASRQSSQGALARSSRRGNRPTPSERKPRPGGAVARELEALGLSPSRAKGQSFLRDERVAARQVMAAAVAPGERVLEVGGGLGVLTRELSKRGALVRVVEVEPSLARHLQRLKLPGVAVECADALEIELGAPDKVVANIPYSVSGELVERLVDSRAGLIVLMVQQEVAERLACEPGSKRWARLPAVVQREYAVEVVEKVPANAFFPQPKVASAVIRLRRKAKVGTLPPSAYRAVVSALFSGRRKKVRNTVARAAAAVHADVERAVPVAEQLGLADRRPEELSVAQFEALAEALASLRMTK